MAESTKCQHERCNCTVAAGQEYCSEYCHDAADEDVVELECDCKHPACTM